MDPLASYAPFPGGIIPASRFSPVAVKLLQQFYPLPNYAGIGMNYQATEPSVGNGSSVLFKVDHRFSDSNSVSIRYGYRWTPSDFPWGASSYLGEFPYLINDNRSMGGITYLHMFSPSLINEARLGFNRNADSGHLSRPAGQPTAADLGIAGSTTNPVEQGVPLINVTNYGSMGYQAAAPQNFALTDYQVGDDLTWIKGRHVLKFGADMAINQGTDPYYTNSRGTMTASGVWTGNGTATNGDAFADLMLGLLASSTINASPVVTYLRWTNYGAYVNDDFRVTPTLTLNLGLRYEIDPPPHDKYGRLMNFVPSLGKIIVASDKNVSNFNQLVSQAGLTGLVGLAKDYGLPNSLVYTNYNNFAPRFGFAWRGHPRLVVRGGYGWFYSSTHGERRSYQPGYGLPVFDEL